ncbi:unnamed protein product [Vitrella brassicaformis CCMP3155]|uniref:Uncharacterized protein n=1 Tax=Vitrella brassicaformis (strain CCMP3155) TaxID=1169540 RepID=A0A0G4GEM9_VITBC|nr:unnamed protein product [Vitrella brassicaformis CCMP3155]|eukprot:CEM27798.1 unnamed protein product [Vitrella brassicaformis CCMP3155]
MEDQCQESLKEIWKLDQSTAPAAKFRGGKDEFAALGVHALFSHLGGYGQGWDTHSKLAEFDSFNSFATRETFRQLVDIMCEEASDSTHPR